MDTGEIIGQHKGVHHWTVGQSCRLSGYPHRLFVLRKDAETNVIWVSPGTQHAGLHTNLVYIERPHWIDEDLMRGTSYLRCQFRFQHTKPLTNCTIYTGSRDGKLVIKLEHSLRAITPGQYAVLYKNKQCLGAARILSPGPSVEFDMRPDERICTSVS